MPWATVTVTGTNIVVTFPGGWTFDTTPVSFDGLVITDPEATIAGVSLATTNITGYTGSASQLYFDGNDVYINFPHPAFSTLSPGASVSVNVQFATSPALFSTIPGDIEQFTATGLLHWWRHKPGRVRTLECRFHAFRRGDDQLDWSG